MQSNIITFLKGSSFDPDTTAAMGAAYDLALKHLQDRGQPIIVQEIIARSVIEVARTGECDPSKLSVMALELLGMDVAEMGRQ